ncbi:MAG: hypothetical protein K1X81_13695 [Bacteroidia bacterium]|nr:hypothetical protein [Bacteroidia bacterium]
MKNIINSILLLFAISHCLNARGQAIRTYTGNFESGNATYQYYENENFERVYCGQFLFKGTGVSVNGNYKDNKRDGNWEWIIVGAAYTLYPEKRVGYKIVISGKYSNGFRQGIWVYEKVEVATNKILMKSTVNFNNDTLIGKYEYYDNNYIHPSNSEHNVSVSGQFDSLGFMDNSWTIRYQENKTKWEDLRKYSNGILYWRLKRNLNTGEITEKLDKTGHISELNTTNTYIEPNEERINFSRIISFWYCFENDDESILTNEMFFYPFPNAHISTNVQIKRE